MTFELCESETQWLTYLYCYYTTDESQYWPCQDTRSYQPLLSWATGSYIVNLHTIFSM